MYFSKVTLSTLCWIAGASFVEAASGNTIRAAAPGALSSSTTPEVKESSSSSWNKQFKQKDIGKQLDALVAQALFPLNDGKQDQDQQGALLRKNKTTNGQEHDRRNLIDGLFVEFCLGDERRNLGGITGIEFDFPIDEFCEVCFSSDGERKLSEISVGPPPCLDPCFLFLVEYGFIPQELYLAMCPIVIPTEVPEYQGAICTTDPVTADLPCNEGNLCDTTKYHFWAFYLTEGVTYTISVDRLNCNVDPVMRLVRGIVPDEFRWCIFDESIPGFIPGPEGFADDNGFFNPECAGPAHLAPFGDPVITITPGDTGIYTLIVASFLSNACGDSGVHEYQLDITPQPGMDCPEAFGGSGWNWRRFGDFPSDMPSQAPSMEETLQIEQETFQPSFQPSSAPSSLPSESPSQEPTEYPDDGNCDDHHFATFSALFPNIRKTCVWLAARVDDMIRLTDESVFTDLTSDELLASKWNVSSLDGFGDTTWSQLLCASGGGGARRVCEETCGTCSDSCEDNDNVPFMDEDGQSVRYCPWLRDEPRNHNKYCAREAGNICYETCETCDRQP